MGRFSTARTSVFLLVALLVGAVAVVALSFGYGFELEEEPLAPAVPVERPATAAEAERAFSTAAAALRRGDRRAWREALPAATPEARRALRELYSRLHALPWSSLRADVRPVPGVPGRFDVYLVGSIGDAGPADRLVADRVLDLRWVPRNGGDDGGTGDRAGAPSGAGAVVVVGDATPKAIRRQYLMAFHRPVAVAGDGVLVVADQSWRPRAERLAEAGAPARARLGTLDLAPDRTVLVFLYASREQLDRSRGEPFPEDRVKYFSAPPFRLAQEESWWPRDIGVLAPGLADAGDWTPLMLSHELTHAFTMRWFDDTRRRPTLLVEGLAVAVEGGRSYEPLRRELARGNGTLPLEDAFGTGDLWLGTSYDRVRLAYLMGGSIVLYVLDGWDVATLRGFVRGVADSDLSRVGIEVVMQSALGVGWAEFVAGWTAYVQTLP
jgi:hypothetical protein